MPPMHMTAGNRAVTNVSVPQVAGTNSDGRQRSGDHDVGAAACDKCVGRHPKDDDPYDGRQWSGDNDVDEAAAVQVISRLHCHL